MTEFHVDGIQVAIISFQEMGEFLASDTSFPHITNPRRRREKQLTAYLLRHCLGVDDPLRLRYTPDGAPYIDGSPFRISVSHSRMEVALAWSERSSIGIDIEQPRAALANVARRFLTPREQEYYTDIPRLLRAWTIKEAVYKAMQIKELTSDGIHLSCTEPASGHDSAVAGGQCFDITLLHLPSGSLLAVASLHCQQPDCAHTP